MIRKRSPNADDAREKIGDFVTIFRRRGVWYVNYQFNGKQIRRSLKTTNKKLANIKAIELAAEVLARRHRLTRKDAMLKDVVEDYEKYLVAEDRANTTLAKVRLVIRHVQALAEERGVKTIAGLDLAFMDAYVAKRNFQSAKTKQHHQVIIRQIVNFAMSRGMANVDPLAGLKIKKAKPTPQPCWTRKQVDQILGAATGPHRPSLVLLAETGMRFGELRWLTWDDVDLCGGVLHIRPKDNWKPKTGDRRAVPISPLARQILEAQSRKSRWVVTAAPSAKYPKGDRQISERRLLAYLKRVLKRLGLPGHLHTFRHSFISNALVNRTPEAIVRKWCGQIDPETIKIYTHVVDDVSLEAMQRLAGINSQPRGKEASETNTEAS